MNLNGILVPMITPFDENNEVDVDRLRELADTYIEKGVTGLVACGTTGEYYTFSEQERATVLQTIADAGKGKVTLIAGISDLSADTAVRRAKEAKALGYDGLMLSVPPYSLPDQEGIIAFFEHVASATDLPIIMYNFPARVGVDIEFDTVARLARHPNIKAIKESSGNFSHALRMLQANFDDFQVICGCDDQPVDYFFWGARSWIAGAANVFPQEQISLFNAAINADWDKAKQIMTAMYPAIHSMESGNYNQKAKVGCLRGAFNAGKVRLPLTNLSETEVQEFLALLK
ncbi:dihydrodipicolinate synthase [Advenella kashmirensis W13003]|uniref:4-hydroxy-tetrahydrodipicolinate synthase n=1 Tax=Advenella kashmirensis W13003 TaxID=1424334 RepID=V8QW55_9BURK|nr:4-hydroxy-tetrahydrodipicolinate synthase [Advenella kashmirensis]ETF04171.1 dihydrodipicolinate synthase [Advenella kashmirensis W13003]